MRGIGVREDQLILSSGAMRRGILYSLFAVSFDFKSVYST